ncbi:MAG: hypothetical protein A2Z91_06650 [Deltaproteobacteria bacterium GWA2_38_16]|nr:MAG: hypothetical protein A2Z91_06650 [Deltaproteobacteria bacterium GWA2_38_16]OGQ03448.1 MAG: hypothetical protein A3D19_04760 [Deltaproteobacteria bacterium RIFCSPHIGHO2_02_FULL_38_15]
MWVSQEDLKKLGARIRNLRIKQGLTIEKLAWENDMSKGNLSEIEKGIRNVRYLTLKKLAEALNVSIKKLVID